MAINYDNLFKDIGEFVQRINSFRTWAADAGDIKTMYTQVVTELTANSMSHLLDEIPGLFDGYRDAVTGWCDDMANQIERRLLDRDTILEQLTLGSSTGIGNVLLELIRNMNAVTPTPETILRTVVTIGGNAATSVTAATAVDVDSSDGKVYVNGVLDGVTSPGSGMPACRDYLGVNTELPIAETMYVTCTGDSDTTGLTEGEEDFEIKGAVPGLNKWDWRGEGSGNGPRLRTLQASGLLTNGEFEDWDTTNIPSGWTVTAGGVAVAKNQTTPKRGSSNLRLTSAGATITLDQEVQVEPGKRYAFAFWLRSTTTPVTGTGVSFGLYGSGYSALSTVSVSVFSGTWTQYCYFLNTPFDLPSTVYFRIDWQTSTTGEVVDIDGLGFGPAVWHNGVCFAVSPGEGTYLIGDRYSIAIAKSSSGVFQEFFRRNYGTQLPSHATTPTRADSLATD